MVLENFKQAERELAKYIPAVRELTGKDITLVRMKPLMRALGNPEKQLKIIHVAGTSGKTSTAYYIASLLKMSGRKVGLTVSPHIERINERIQINLEPLPEQVFCQELTEFLELIKGVDPQPTYFELMVAFVYWYFAKIKLDYAVIETGLGGLHDATNVANNPDKVCVITDIGFDHMHVLGNRLVEIAGQKAGIMYLENQVFMHEQSNEITDIVRQYAEKHKALLNVLSNIGSPLVELKQLPEFQQRNWLLAYKVYRYVQQLYGLPKLNHSKLVSTLSTKIPGRMEERTIDGKTVIFDGAHNGQKTEAFVRSFQARYINKRAAILLSLKEGKDYQSVLPLLKPICSTLIITAYTTSQDLPVVSMNPQNLADAATSFGFENVSVEADYIKAFDLALSSRQEIVIVTGSFYLISCLKPHITSL